MPTATKYRELIDDLRLTSSHIANAPDEQTRLQTAILALEAVIHYLRSDAEVVRDKLTQPLGHIFTALYDSRKGATVPLLEHSPGRVGKPAGQMHEHVQAHLSVALELVIRNGKGTAAAAQWLAAEVGRAGIRTTDGARVVARQLLNWRQELSRGKGPEMARTEFDRLREKYRARGLMRAPRKYEQAEESAKMIIANLAGIVPRAAPKQTRRLKQ